MHLTAPGDTLEVAHPRTVIVIGQNASAAIIESFVGLDGAALRNTDTTISLGADATLTHHRVQTEAGGRSTSATPTSSRPPTAP